MANKWVKMWERGEYNLYKMQSVTVLFCSPYARTVLGKNLTGLAAVQMPNQTHAFYITKQDLDYFKKFILKTFSSNTKFAVFIKQYEKLKKDFINTSRLVGEHAATARTAGDLLKLFERLRVIDDKYMLIGQWSFFYLAELAEEKVRKMLKAKIKNPASRDEYLRIILTPEHQSQIRQEREQLLRIALIKNAREREQKLRQHAKNFEWIPCINILDPQPWPLSFFRRELAAIIKSGQAAKELRTIRQTQAAANQSFAGLLRLRQFTQPERALLRRTRLLAFIKDDRDDARRRAYYYATPLYVAIARHLGILSVDLLLYTNDEIFKALRTGKILSRSELKRRQAGYALLIKNRKIVVKTGSSYLRFLNSLLAGESHGNDVKGITAAPGLAAGRARIVLSATTLSKVKPGDILVTVTTHPDYLPAMRLAAAFVTDEGGLTSHAAIVAREMVKPCIVGTKNATKIFKDGDKIEVDANKGVVKKV